jgi:hypothetical protein
MLFIITAQHAKERRVGKTFFCFEDQYMIFFFTGFWVREGW